MELKELIRTSPKQTPIKVFLKQEIQGLEKQIYSHVFIGEWEVIKDVLQSYSSDEYRIEADRRNSALPLADIKNIKARIEPGAIVRETALIGNRAIIMMGAILNAGCVIGEDTMIDMGAVIGAQVQIGARCHIGANAVIAGILEPPGSKNVCIGDDVLIGANAVILEGVSIGKNAVIGAGSIVLHDVQENEVVAGNPARLIKMKDEKTTAKSELVMALRELE